MYRAIVFVCLVLSLVTGTARAQEGARRVLVVRTGQEPPCLEPAALASAITRHSAFPSQVVGEQPAHQDRAVEVRVEVRVEGGGTKVEVQVMGSGHDLKRSFERAPCETLPGSKIVTKRPSRATPKLDVDARGRIAAPSPP